MEIELLTPLSPRPRFVDVGRCPVGQFVRTYEAPTQVWRSEIDSLNGCSCCSGWLRTLLHVGVQFGYLLLSPSVLGGDRYGRATRLAEIKLGGRPEMDCM
jgi:hypothetical protein